MHVQFDQVAINDLLTCTYVCLAICLDISRRLSNTLLGLRCDTPRTNEPTHGQMSPMQYNSTWLVLGDVPLSGSWCPLVELARIRKGWVAKASLPPSALPVPSQCPPSADLFLNMFPLIIIEINIV